MANYRAIASGNWSAGATWGGGAVPPDAAGHNIYSNGFTVTIDQNINVALLTNASNAGTFVGGGTAAAGGSFSVTANGISVIANITASAALAVNALNFSAISPSALSISGNLTGGGTGAGGGHAVNNSSTGIININTATITPGTFNSQGNGVRNSSTGQVNLNNCVITGVGRNQEAGVYNAGGGVINASNCSFGGGISIYSTSSVVATNCTFTAATGTAALEGSGTLRLSGSFVAATNGRQPINAAAWILNSTPTASYIQHALDGINANSFVRYYTADNNLGQANPTDVRSGVSYASGNLTGRLTVPARGSVALSVNYGPSMPFTATRSGTTATATLAYSYPLVVGDQITVTGASNSEWNSTYTIASIVSGTSVTFEVPASHSATAGTGATMQTTGTAVLDPASIASAVQSALTAQGLTSARAGNLDNLDTTVSSRLAPSGTLATVTTLTNAPASVTASDIWSYATRTTTGGTVDTLTNAPSVPSASAIASQVRTELGTELGRIDQAISSRLAAADYTAPTAAPSVVAIRQEMDANSTKLANLDATVSSRLAGSSYTAPTTPPTAAEIATAVEGSLLNEADGQAVLNAIVGAIGNTNLSEVSLVAAVRADLERAGGKLDNIPTTAAPSASAVASATRTELSTELSRIDQSISSRLAASSYTAPANSDIAAIKAKTDNLPASPAATGDIPSANITAIKAKTDLLNTERLANVPTVNILGTLLAQANS